MFMTNVSVSGSASSSSRPGKEKAVGLITSDYRKDQSDPAWADDPGMKEWRDFMARYIPDGDMGDNNYTYAYGVGLTLLQVLKQCGNDFSRENILKQATNIAPLELPTLLPGVKVSTSPTTTTRSATCSCSDGTARAWVRFGNVIEGANV